VLGKCDALQLVVDGIAANHAKRIGQEHAGRADNTCACAQCRCIAQGSLRSPGDGGAVVFDLQGSLLRVPDDPEEHRIHVDRDRVLRQGHNTMFGQSSSFQPVYH
jgi:hypothetical protein